MYNIEFLTDEHDCETCGWIYSEGYVIRKNGEVVVDHTPIASCFGGENHPHGNAYADILRIEGIEWSEVNNVES